MSRREVRKITQARKDVFLSVLGETGSRAAAAAAASPHTDGGKGLRPGYETFRDLWKRDPEFALAVEQAEAKALGRVEAEIVNRAFTLDERPIFDRQGNRIGTQTSSNASNQMLLRLAVNALQLIKKVIGSSRLRSLRTEDATISLKAASVWIQAAARHQQVSSRLILGMDGPDSIAERGLQRSGLVRRDVGRLVTPAIGL